MLQRLAHGFSIFFLLLGSFPTFQGVFIEPQDVDSSPYRLTLDSAVGDLESTGEDSSQILSISNSSDLQNGSRKKNSQESGAPRPTDGRYATSSLSANLDLIAPQASSLNLLPSDRNGTTPLHQIPHSDRKLLRRQNRTPQLLNQNSNIAPIVVNPMSIPSNSFTSSENLTLTTNNSQPILNFSNATIGRNRSILSPGNDKSNNNKTFSDLIQITGGHIRNQVTWVDGLAVDLISATPHILSIKKNMSPPSGKFVTAADPSRFFLGGDWRELTNYSYQIVFEGEFPDDLSLKLSVPYDKIQPPVSPDEDVYLVIFDAKRGGWVVDTERMLARRKEKRADLIGISAPSGEYRLLSRANTPRSPTFFNFGSGADGQFKVLAPPSGNSATPPLQVGTWQDGSKVIIRSAQSLQIQIEIRNISRNALPSGYETATRSGFAVTTNEPGATVAMNLQFTYVPTQLQEKGINPDELLAAGRPLGSSQQYQILCATTISGNGALMNTPMSKIEGDYILLAPAKSSRD